MSKLLKALVSVVVVVLILCIAVFAVDSEVVVFDFNVVAGDGLVLYGNEALTQEVNTQLGDIVRGDYVSTDIYIFNSTDGDLNIYYTYFSTVATASLVVEDFDNTIPEDNIVLEVGEYYLLSSGASTDGWVTIEIPIDSDLNENTLYLEIHGESL